MTDYRGGWGAVLIYGNFLREIWGYEPKGATSFRMELLAIIRALDRHKRCHDITIFTDNDIIVDSVSSGRLFNWIAGNWSKTNGKVQDKDLWSILYWHLQRHKITWRKVKAHSGDRFNNHADRLASLAIKQKTGGEAEYFVQPDGSLTPLVNREATHA